MTYSIGTIAATAIALAILSKWRLESGKLRSRRPAVILPSSERVLILGASGGIGRTIAYRYALRGAKICVVGRRSAELDTVRSECEVLARASRGNASSSSEASSSVPVSVLSICGDITRPQDLISIRERLTEGELYVTGHSLRRCISLHVSVRVAWY
jgi:NAD(P)-dependent dehydrogenase (short-subunit alcohol dehydrogenase family)